MNWHTILSAFRDHVQHPEPHTHLVGFSAVRESSDELLAWTAGDLKHYPFARFLDGTDQGHAEIRVSPGHCPLCGAEVIFLTPLAAESRLPEALPRKPTRQDCA